MMPLVDYTTRAARFLLGATAHPGGEELTRHLLDRMALAPGAVVADVACGAGATLTVLRSQGQLAVGVDLTPTHVVGDAQCLPLRSSAYDGVLIECSLSTFDRPQDALSEVRRVLRPGGVLGLTDVLLDRSAATDQVVRAIDRLTHARTLIEYIALLEDAGMVVTATEDRGDDAQALVRRIRRRLPLSRTVRACEQAIREGSLGYGLLTAVSPEVRP